MDSTVKSLPTSLLLSFLSMLGAILVAATEGKTEELSGLRLVQLPPITHYQAYTNTKDYYQHSLPGGRHPTKAKSHRIAVNKSKGKALSRRFFIS